MERIIRGRSATLTHTFYVGSTATDPNPDAATVTITRDDGTAIVTGAAATEAGTGVVSYTLTPAQTAQLDVLTVAWTAAFGGQAQTFTDTVEIAGGVFFTIAQLRAMNSQLANETKYPDSAIVEARTLAETALEDACDVAFVPRYRRETFNGVGASQVVLRYSRVSAVRSLKNDGTSVSGAVPSGDGVLYLQGGFAAGFGNWDIAYEHGYPEPPPRVAQAALLLAKNWLIKGPVDDRQTAMTTDDGTFSLSTPGLRGATFGIPEVDAVVAAYSVRCGVA